MHCFHAMDSAPKIKETLGMCAKGNQFTQTQPALKNSRREPRGQIRESNNLSAFEQERHGGSCLPILIDYIRTAQIPELIVQYGGKSKAFIKEETTS